MNPNSLLIPDRPKIVYPESDGKPMAENTLQFEWIVTIKENLELRFRDDPNVFVAGDLFWYPVEGHPEICQAPDALTVHGRPKGHRGSYRQWEEGGIAPQVVFEVLSPSNRLTEMMRKFRFYELHGVEEYYVYDPDDNRLEGWIRREGVLTEIADLSGWVSPQLGIRFEPGPDMLRIYFPDGRLFLTFLQLDLLRQEAESRAAAANQQAEQAQQQAEQAQQQAEQAQQQAEQAQQQAEQARQRVERLAAQLRSLGVEPEA